MSSSICYDERLNAALDFVCRIFGIKKEYFATTALVSLLDEELNRVKYDQDHSSLSQEDLKKLKHHRKTVKEVQSQTNSIIW